MCYNTRKKIQNVLLFIIVFALSAPSVSVVVATLNGSKSIEYALRSIQAQTFTSFETIVVDDSSTDTTEDIIATFLSDTRFKYLRNTKRRGPSYALNRGIEHSTGKYLAFLDDDNTWEPESIETLYHELESHPSSILAYGGRNWKGYWVEKGDRVLVDDHVELPPSLTHQTVWNPLYDRDGIFRTYVDTNTMFIRREPLLSVGGWDENLFRKQDWELTLRLIDKYPGLFSPLTVPLANYNLSLGDHPGERETAYATGYTFMKHFLGTRAENVSWWPRNMLEPRLADYYKQQADKIRGYSLDTRSGKEINGNLTYQPTPEEWLSLIIEKIPAAKKYEKKYRKYLKGSHAESKKSLFLCGNSHT